MVEVVQATKTEGRTWPDTRVVHTTTTPGVTVRKATNQTTALHAHPTTVVQGTTAAPQTPCPTFATITPIADKTIVHGTSQPHPHTGSMDQHNSGTPAITADPAGTLEADVRNSRNGGNGVSTSPDTRKGNGAAGKHTDPNRRKRSSAEGARAMPPAQDPAHAGHHTTPRNIAPTMGVTAGNTRDGRSGAMTTQIQMTDADSMMTHADTGMQHAAKNPGSRPITGMGDGGMIPANVNPAPVCRTAAARPLTAGMVGMIGGSLSLIVTQSSGSSVLAKRGIFLQNRSSHMEKQVGIRMGIVSTGPVGVGRTGVPVRLRRGQAVGMQNRTARLRPDRGVA